MMPIASGKSASAEPSKRWVIPALQATMGDWVYYAAVVTLADVATRVTFAEIVHGADRGINELIQRELDDRATSIANYLITQKKERFFNSLVIGLYEGNPDWYYASLETHNRIAPDQIPDYSLYALGLLSFDGSEVLFALDGQHRLAGIREALERQPSLGRDLVTALFVPHDNSAKGLERTRRLFTTLNRYAKRVPTARLIALDEDDAVAIVTRRLILEHRLFFNRTSTKSPKSIPRSDKASVTSIGALYDANDGYLRLDRNLPSKRWKEYKRDRPSDADLATMFKRISTLWTRLAAAIPAFRATMIGPPETPSSFRRKEDGGDLWLRPIGTMMLIDTVVALKRAQFGEPDAVRRVASIPSALDEDPWKDLLWDSTNHVMITHAENRRVGTALALHLCGGDVGSLGFTQKTLELRWSGRVKRSRRLTQLKALV